MKIDIVLKTKSELDEIRNRCNSPEQVVFDVLRVRAANENGSGTPSISVNEILKAVPEDAPRLLSVLCVLGSFTRAGLISRVADRDDAWDIRFREVGSACP